MLLWKLWAYQADGHQLADLNADCLPSSPPAQVELTNHTHSKPRKTSSKLLLFVQPVCYLTTTWYGDGDVTRPSAKSSSERVAGIVVASELLRTYDDGPTAILDNTWPKYKPPVHRVKHAEEVAAWFSRLKGGVPCRSNM